MDKIVPSTVFINPFAVYSVSADENTSPKRALTEFVVNLNGLTPVLQRGFVVTLGSGIENVPVQVPFASDVRAAPIELPVGVTYSDTEIESKKAKNLEFGFNPLAVNAISFCRIKGTKAILVTLSPN